MYLHCVYYACFITVVFCMASVVRKVSGNMLEKERCNAKIAKTSTITKTHKFDTPKTL